MALRVRMEPQKRIKVLHADINGEMFPFNGIIHYSARKVQIYLMCRFKFVKNHGSQWQGRATLGDQTFICKNIGEHLLKHSIFSRTIDSISIKLD
jgi:hypothetical protein